MRYARQEDLQKLALTMQGSAEGVSLSSTNDRQTIYRIDLENIVLPGFVPPLIPPSRCVFLSKLSSRSASCRPRNAAFWRKAGGERAIGSPDLFQARNDGGPNHSTVEGRLVALDDLATDNQSHGTAGARADAVCILIDIVRSQAESGNASWNDSMAPPPVGRARAGIFIERLWRSLKYECVYLRAWETRSQALAGIGRWITFYSNLRPLAARGGQPPAVVCFNVIATDRR